MMVLFTFTFMCGGSANRRAAVYRFAGKSWFQYATEFSHCFRRNINIPRNSAVFYAPRSQVTYLIIFRGLWGDEYCTLFPFCPFVPSRFRQDDVRRYARL